MGDCCSTLANVDEGKFPQDNTKSLVKVPVVADNVAVLEQFNPVQTFKGGNKKLRFRDIVAKPLELSPNFVAPVHDKSVEEKKLIRKALNSNFIFSQLGESELEVLINAFELIKVSPDDKIINQGDIGDYFYVIKKGTIEYIVDNEKVGKATSGDSFGEWALLYNCPRSASCVAVQSCELFRVDQESFRRIVAANQIQKYEEKLKMVQSVDIFKDLGVSTQTRITEVLVEKRFKAGDVYATVGSECTEFLIVKNGSLLLTDIVIGSSEYDDKLLEAGSHFGAMMLINNESSYCTVVVKSDCVLWTVEKEDFLKVIGSMEAMVKRTQERMIIRHIPCIYKARLNDEEFESLMSMFNTFTFTEDHLFNERGGKYEPTLYFIESGSVKRTSKSGLEQILRQNEYFGDDLFEVGSDKAESKYRIQANELTICRVITLSALKIAFPMLSQSINRNSMTKIESIPTNLTLDTIKKHQILGAGTFGQVWLVTDNKENTAYALKIQSKRLLLEYNQDDGVIREKNIMAKLNHPFIIKLVDSFQDDKCLYMITKLYQGGELYGLLTKTNYKGLEEKNAAFYGAGVFTALNYMHQRKIIYRDLKPENVLIDSSGYCVIIDLGFAKVVKLRTYTMCGTPLYIAPEVILQRGHNKSADIWSFGVLLYELITGETPFYKDGMEQRKLFRNICNCDYKFPSRKVVSKEAKDLISRILVKRPPNRLGMLAKGESDIQHHPWFGDIHFFSLSQKRIEAPWIPPVENDLDSSNFDKFDESEIYDYTEDKALSEKENMLFEDF